jgi:hypothetical protein
LSKEFRRLQARAGLSAGCLGAGWAVRREFPPGGNPRGSLSFLTFSTKFVALRRWNDYKPLFHRKDSTMAHNYAINDDVHHQLQGPQGRAVVKQRSVYTIVSRLPIEADGRPRYRIKSKTENVERVVTEEQISRLG